MAQKLIYITNDPQVARIAEAAGTGRVFVDMEYIGKDRRQGGLDTVQLHHTPQDVRNIRGAIFAAELLVRINPIHDAGPDFSSTEEEIEAVIAAGADLIMLPYYKTRAEAERFLSAVDGRAKTVLLLETPQAADHLDEILALPGIDEMYIGLNDLSIGYGKKFLFELLADGTVEALAGKIRAAGLPFGFGGIAKPGGGALPAERIIREQVRLGSTRAILSRAFLNSQKEKDPEKIKDIFESGIRGIRAAEEEARNAPEAFFEENRRELKKTVAKIVEGLG